MPAQSGRRSGRQRGSIEELPSGALRAALYAGCDPRTGRRHYLRQVIPAGLAARSEAQKVLRRLVTQVDERRNPRTNTTVDQLLDRYFEPAELEQNTLTNYRGLAGKHIRPLIGERTDAAPRTLGQWAVRCQWHQRGSWMWADM